MCFRSAREKNQKSYKTKLPRHIYGRINKFQLVSLAYGSSANDTDAQHIYIYIQKRDPPFDPTTITHNRRPLGSRVVVTSRERESASVK